MLARQHSVFGCLPLAALPAVTSHIPFDASRDPPFGGRVIGEISRHSCAAAKASLERDIEKLAPELWWAMSWVSATAYKPTFSATKP
jgi:hypothetical protein